MERQGLGGRRVVWWGQVLGQAAGPGLAGHRPALLVLSALGRVAERNGAERYLLMLRPDTTLPALVMHATRPVPGSY